MGCCSVIVSPLLKGTPIGRSRLDRKGENPATGRLQESDERGQRKLHVLLEPGDADPYEAKRAGPIAQGPVEERAGELADPLGVIRADRERRRPDRKSVV